MVLKRAQDKTLDSEHGVVAADKSLTLLRLIFPIINRKEGQARSFMDGDIVIPIEEVFRSVDRSFNIQFGTVHPGGVNLVRADSSTIFLSRDIDPDTLAFLTGSADGNVVPPF